MKNQPHTVHIAAPSSLLATPYKSNAQVSAHTGGKNHALASNQLDSDTLIAWTVGVKIDQITHGLYLHPVVMDNGVADVIQDVTDALGSEVPLPCELSGYHLNNSKGGQAYTVRLGIKHGKHHIGNLFVCPLDGFGNLPFVRVDTYTHKIQRLGLIEAYQDYLNTLISSAVTPYILESRISRLDFAVDLPLNPMAYLWFALGIRSHLVYEGKTPTWYFGGVKSCWRFRIYNKKVQLLDLPQPVGITQPHMLRIELSLGNGKGIPHGNAALLSTLKNHWEKIFPIRVSDLPLVIKECKDPQELAKAIDMGLHAYLRTFSDTKRHLYSKKLRSLTPPEEWNPAAIWEECLKQAQSAPFMTMC